MDDPKRRRFLPRNLDVSPGVKASPSASRRAVAQLASSAEGRATARRAKLRYVSDPHEPGLSRRATQSGFRFVDAAGKPVRDAETVARARKLAIPPAWRDVWICADPRGHLQATGLDARGRKQYRYHADFRAAREADKFGRLAQVGLGLAALRARVERDLRKRSLGRETVLAAIVRLLDLTGMRAGNEEYVRDNGSYGVTTLERRHARLAARRLTLSYRGKSSVHRTLSVDDLRLLRVVQRCHALGAKRLFAWVDEQGRIRTIRSAELNDYLRESAGAPITAKCLRTWIASVRMAEELARAGQGAPLRAALQVVAAELGHTPAVCRKSYVHPMVLQAHDSGKLQRFVEAEERSSLASRLRAEQGLLALLQASMRRPPTRAATPRPPTPAVAKPRPVPKARPSSPRLAA